MRLYAERWQAAQAWRPATVRRVDLTVRNHVLPTFGVLPIAVVRPSELQA